VGLVPPNLLRGTHIFSGVRPWPKRATNSEDPDLAGIDAAFRRAAKRALQIGLETGTPVYVLENGKIVDLTKRYRRKPKP